MAAHGYAAVEMGGASKATEEGAAERSVRARPDTLPRGSTVGRYVVLDVIGRGGMGVVYSAYDSQLDRKIAVKFLHADVGEQGSHSEGRTRLLREAQAMARLSHPNVVAIHDVGTHGEQVFLAMELIDGVTLGEWLKTPRGWRETVEVLVAAGHGLAAAHEAGLIHRDFKPDNVLIGRDGRVTVTDFGVARDQRSRTESLPSGPSPASLDDSAERRARVTVASGSSGSTTLTGSLLGTIGYMSPEQAWEETIDARTDQFSLAATLFYALYGERPFPGDDLESYLDALTQPPREPKAHTDVPRWLHEIIVRALSVRPDARYPSMNALLVALLPNANRRRMRLVAIAIAAAVVVSGLAVSLAVREHRRSVYAICDGGRGKLAGVWDDDLRRGVRAAFVATGVGGAEETYRRVAERLDAHTSEWVAMDGEACAATNIRREQTSEVLGLRMACLDRERTEIKSLTALFARADAAIVQRAIEATFGLTSPSWCADVAGLRTAVGLPDNRELRDKVVEVRASIAEADALRVSGRTKDALVLAQEALDRAKLVPFPALTAEAWMLIGATHEYAGDYSGAVGPYKQTVFAGQRARADALIARAAARLAFILGDKLFRVDEAEDWWELATASLDRLGEDQSVLVDLLAARAVLLVAEGRPEESLPLHEKAIAIRTKTLGLEHPQTATAINNLGYTYQMLGQFDRAMEKHLQSFA
ncbi:MAG: serine/threonine-protein kinase, partial [Polyangiales bacterium]